MFTLLLSLALSACSAAPDLRKSLAFELHMNDIIVPVRVQGHGPFRFLLDTGSTRSLLTARLAADLRMNTDSRTRMLTPAGEALLPVAITTLQLPGHRAYTSAVTVVAASELAGVGPNIDGILGQDVLASHSYTLDYARREIRWGVSPCSVEGSRLPLQFSSGRALVTLPGLDDAPLRFVPDSGADALVLFARRGRALPPLTPLNVGVLRTLAGQQLVRNVVVERLKVGDYTLIQQAGVVIDADRTDMDADGLLPLHLFSRVTFNALAGYLMLER
jgi:hypothetical protein